MSSLWSVLNVKLVKLSHFLKDSAVAAYENNKNEENLKIFVQLRRQTAGYLWDVWISEDLEQRNSRCEGKNTKGFSTQALNVSAVRFSSLCYLGIT